MYWISWLIFFTALFSFLAPTDRCVWQKPNLQKQERRTVAIIWWWVLGYTLHSSRRGSYLLVQSALECNWFFQVFNSLQLSHEFQCSFLIKLMKREERCSYYFFLSFKHKLSLLQAFLSGILVSFGLVMRIFQGKILVSSHILTRGDRTTRWLKRNCGVPDYDTGNSIQKRIREFMCR